MITLIGATQAQTLKEALVAQDKDIYDAFIKGDANTFSSLLTDDSIAVIGNGVMTKADMMKQFTEKNTGRLVSITFEDEQAYSPAPNTAILTYNSKRDEVDSSGKHTTYAFRESTVFVKKNGKWLSAFHQISQPMSQ
jgi:ketosteroid isomerase-like protein